MCSWCVGFGETEDEAEIAFNTGVLGERAYGLVPSRLLIVRHSLCLLPHPILDFTTLGMLSLSTCPTNPLTGFQATIAQKHGTRIVLTTSLLGSAATVAIFGTSTSLKQALCVRLLQGIFGGAVGVARGSVAFITDPSNEGRAYAILG